MTYVIEKDFTFSASHEIGQLPSSHKCSRMHGHNYIVRVRLTSETLDKYGFVLDYGELAPFQEWIDRLLDHRHLNTTISGQTVTAEALARYLASVVPQVVELPKGVAVAAVGVSETPKTWAWWMIPEPAEPKSGFAAWLNAAMRTYT